MARARRAGLTALIVVVLVASIAGWRGTRVLAAAVAWPPSTLVVSELQTGGTSASDEFVELANQGAMPVDLGGLEVVYATSSGSTVTRKATWTTATILAPGQRLLIANAAGVHAVHRRCDLCRRLCGDRRGDRVAGRRGQRDRCRRLGRCDERVRRGHGCGGPAGRFEPRAGARCPAGNGTDTNDNSVDWFVQAAPSPQGLAAPPVPGPTATPDPDARPRRRARRRLRRRPRRPRQHDADAHPGRNADRRTDADADGRADRDARPRHRFRPRRRLRRRFRRPFRPRHRRPFRRRHRGRCRSPWRVPWPTVSRCTIAGVLTTDLGALESGHGGFVEDASGGIALYLDAAVVGVVAGRHDDRTSRERSTVAIAQRTLRVAEASTRR